MFKSKIESVIKESIRTKQELLEDKALVGIIETVTNVCIEALRADKKILFAGNGGSAADAQHLAAELSGRFYLDREPLNAEALHVNSSFLTAIANDYSFDEAYARILRAKASKGDVLFCISTSGNSANIIKALEAAKVIGMVTVGLTGVTGGQLKTGCDYLINIPSTDTPRIQESHIMVGHIICELVEAALFQ
jgi:D-sedoheptulose 7-phosphate isomerase